MKSLFKKIIVATLLVCGSWFSSYAQSNVVPDDIEFAALKAIYDSLGGANWTTKTNWPAAGNWPATATAAQMGTWYGVTVVNGDVTKIIFIGNKLIGFVPTHIGNLQRLEMMTFANDKGIVGAIPATIGNLLRLKSVSFAQCNLTRIPASLFNLPSMTSLALHENNISGALPSTMGNATSLVALTINNNKLSGSIPSSIGALLNLTSAKMQYNAFTGAIPSSMGNLVKLTYLSIDNNQLTESIPASIGNLTKLTVLSLKGNQLSGSIPEEIGNMVELQTLTLFRNQLTGAIPSSIGALHKLTFLDLSSNQLTGTIPDTIGGLTLLGQLLLNSNKLSGVIPSSFSGLTNLGVFTLNDNQLSGPVPGFIGNMTGLSNLQLQGNQLTGSIPASFGNLTNLITLFLHANQLSGKLPSSLGNLSKLQNFYVNNNKFSGSLPATLNGMVQLKLMMLNDNQFSGSLPALALAELTQIQLHNNLFTGPFPETSGMPKLTNISAFNNRLTSLPPSLLGNTMLSLINLTNNDLSSIPDFSTQVNKAYLNLSIQNNRLDFSQLEPLVGGGIKVVSLLSQKTINDITTISLTVGSPLVINAASFTGSFSTVSWERQSANGQFVLITTDQAGNPQDQDSNPRTYTRTSATTADEGVYRWKMTNTKVTGVTLYCEPITVKTPVRFALDNWAFQYKYDGRKRMTHKKVPGADWVYMVYDDRDRLVMTQDGEQRKTNKWSFTKYDALNRPVMTGIYTHNSANVTQEDMSTKISTSVFATTYTGLITDAGLHGYSNTVFPKLNDTAYPNSKLEPLTISYYDNYDFITDDSYLKYKADELTDQYTESGNASTRVIGQVTGMKTRTLGTDIQWQRTVNYYDDKYRVVQNVSDDYRQGLQRTTNRYDFVGKVKESKTSTTDQQVHWTNLTNVTTARDKLKKSVLTGYSGASSVEMIPASSNGWIEFTYSDLSQLSYAGLASQYVNAAYNSINYGVILSKASNKGTVQAYEFDAAKSPQYNVDAGDIIRIERIGTTIYWKKNGIIFWQTPPTAPSTSQLMGYLSMASGFWSEFYNPKMSIAGATQSVARTFDYDHAGRLLTTHHSINGATPILLAKNEYNELGQLIDKNLHSTDGTTFKQSTDYRYNIRGWLTSINNAELTPGNNNDDASNMGRDLFGMELAYDKPVVELTTNNDVEYNGNISAITYSNNLALGTIKSNGYKFNYDPMNRLTESNFRQKKNDKWELSNYLDEEEGLHEKEIFSETGFQYDLNGNIKKLNRSAAAGPVAMDELDYTYEGNQLLSVKDTGDKTKGFVDGNILGNDYTYDRNGNMITDANKGITAITYNHLNLPDKVTKATGDYLKYIYDATGRKLSQQVFNVTNVLKKRSDYAGEYFYENDTLKFINHEEGRVVMVSEGQPIAPEYQYHLKDHLGNVRTTFTTKEEVVEATGTLENAFENTERSEFVDYDNAKKVNSVLLDHTNGLITGRAIRLIGRENERNGMTRTLSVMPGDVINLEVYAKYIDSDDTHWSVALNTLISQVRSNTAGVVIDGAGYLTAGATQLPVDLINHENESDGVVPKAYVNYIFINRDFDPASVKHRFERVTEAARETGFVNNVATADGKAHERITLTEEVTEAGYVYVYLSNDTYALMGGKEVEVYFDDFKVTHTKSPVIQQDEYYPFGLSFNSYQRENGVRNKWKFQGQEHVDDLGLNWDSFKWRNHQPDIGRFFNIDPLSDKYYYNSPYAFSENHVISHRELEGLEKIHFMIRPVSGVNPSGPRPFSSGENHEKNIMRFTVDLATSKVSSWDCGGKCKELRGIDASKNEDGSLSIKGSGSFSWAGFAAFGMKINSNLNDEGKGTLTIQSAIVTENKAPFEVILKGNEPDDNGSSILLNTVQEIPSSSKFLNIKPDTNEDKSSTDVQVYASKPADGAQLGYVKNSSDKNFTNPVDFNGEKKKKPTTAKQ